MLLFIVVIPVYAQRAFRILQRDTTVASGTVLQLSIDSTRIFSNFVFCAQKPETGRWTVWHRNNENGKYEPLFNDRFDRMNVVVSADRHYLLYVRYKQQRPGAMYYATLDSAWVCVSDIYGGNEVVVFLVPEYNKNAIYDLDWSSDKKRILYSYGNDEYPSLTRDGDIFEYDIVTNTLTNLTNDWQLWSKNCRYTANDRDFAYSHFANFWEALPTDIFIQRQGQPREQVTNSTNYTRNYKFCTLTDIDGAAILYRRGLYFDNKLYRKEGNKEETLFATPGYGGIRLEKDVFAATDLYNNIYLFTSKATIGSIKVSGVKTFTKDHAYNYALDCNTRLNWMGRQPVNIQWSIGDQQSAIVVRPFKTTTYYCRVEMNGIAYTDSVVATVAGPRPVITKNCLTLATGGHYTTYQWMLDGRPLPGATDSAFTPDQSGSYAVSVTDKKGRAGSSASMTVTGETESIRKQNELISIIADPATNTLNISAPFTLNMILTDEKGRVVKQQTDVHVVALSELPDGDYTMVLYNNSCIKLRAKKVVKRG